MTQLSIAQHFYALLSNEDLDSLAKNGLCGVLHQFDMSQWQDEAMLCKFPDGSTLIMQNGGLDYSNPLV